MAAAMNMAVVFLTGVDKKALRGVARCTRENPLSLQEQLLAMTRRANAVQERLAAMTVHARTMESHVDDAVTYIMSLSPEVGADRDGEESTNSGSEGTDDSGSEGADDSGSEPPDDIEGIEGSEGSVDVSCTVCGLDSIEGMFYCLEPDDRIVCNDCLDSDPTNPVVSSCF